jgi:hypothetical protein
MIIFCIKMNSIYSQKPKVLSSNLKTSFRHSLSSPSSFVSNCIHFNRSAVGTNFGSLLLALKLLKLNTLINFQKISALLRNR